MSSGLKPKTFPAVIISTANERKPLSDTSLLVYEVSVQSLSTNAAKGYIGDETVTSADGLEVLPGDPVVVELPARARATDQFDIKDVYVTSATVGTEFRVSAWIRE